MCAPRDRGELTYSVPNAPDAKLQHWGRVDDVLMIRFAGEIAAPAAAVWDIIRDGSRRAELDELLDQSCVPSALAIHMPSSSQQPRLAAQTLASSPVGLCVLLIYLGLPTGTSWRIYLR